jgi:acetate---CoA ligase (ADP-forming)
MQKEPPLHQVPASSRSLERMFEPRSIAIVGASSDTRKTGGRPLLYLVKHGFKGNLYPVNPGRDSIGEHTCYPSLSAIGAPVDLALVLSSAEQVEEIIVEGIGCGVRNFIVFSSGFAELGGAQGADLQARLSQLARDSGASILGPNCVGIMNADSHLCATIASIGETADLTPGVASLVSQSGAISGYWLDKVLRAGLGFSKWISSGNECDIDLADAIDYLATDDRTRVISLYIESIRNPGKLRAAISKARQNGKFLVALRSGRSEAGAAAVVSHTAALASDSDVADAFLRQNGVVQVESITQMVDVTKVLAAYGGTPLRNPAVASISGGAGALLADALSSAGFRLMPPSATTTKRIESFLPSFGKVANPLDVTGAAGAQPKLFSDCFAALMSDDSYDFGLLFLGLLHGVSGELATGFVAASRASGRPTVAIWMGASPAVVATLQSQGIAVFDDIPQAVEAISLANSAADWAGPESSRIATLEFSAEARYAGAALSEHGARQHLQRNGVGVVWPASALVTSVAQVDDASARLGFPLVAKLQSGKLLHKTEHGAVILGIADARGAADAVGKLIGIGEHLGIECDGVMLQRMLRFRHELIVGLRWDAVFGPVLLVGRGGTDVEHQRDAAIVHLPATVEHIAHAIGSLRMAPALLHPRAGPPVNLLRLAQTIAELAELYIQSKDVFELEINPLAIQEDGSAAALDVLMRLSNGAPPDSYADGYVTGESTHIPRAAAHQAYAIVPTLE